MIAAVRMDLIVDSKTFLLEKVVSSSIKTQGSTLKTCFLRDTHSLATPYQDLSILKYTYNEGLIPIF
jgi:hypothetical protein